MYLDLRILFTIARHVKRLENLPLPGPHRSRHICHATIAWVTPLPNFPFLLFFARAAGASFRAPPIFHSRVPNFYCLRGPAPLVFKLAYFCCTSFRTLLRLRFCGIFHPLLWRFPYFLAASFAANLPPRACQSGHESSFVWPPFFRLPAAPWVGRFRVSILTDRVFVTLFRQFRYSLAGSKISSQTVVILSCQVVSVSPALFVGGSFLLRQSFGSSDCRIELVNFFTSHFKILEEFASGFVPTLIRSDSDPTWIRFTHNCSISSSHSMFTR